MVDQVKSLKSIDTIDHNEALQTLPWQYLETQPSLPHNQLQCKLSWGIFGLPIFKSTVGDQERERGREGGRERILPLDCILVYDLTMYTVHVSIAHWIHCSTAM